MLVVIGRASLIHDDSARAVQFDSDTGARMRALTYAPHVYVDAYDARLLLAAAPSSTVGHDTDEQNADHAGDDEQPTGAGWRALAGRHPRASTAPARDSSASTSSSSGADADAEERACDAERYADVVLLPDGSDAHHHCVGDASARGDLDASDAALISAAHAAAAAKRSVAIGFDYGGMHPDRIAALSTSASASASAEADAQHGAAAPAAAAAAASASATPVSVSAFQLAVMLYTVRFLVQFDAEPERAGAELAVLCGRTATRPEFCFLRSSDALHAPFLRVLERERRRRAAGEALTPVPVFVPRARFADVAPRLGGAKPASAAAAAATAAAVLEERRKRVRTGLAALAADTAQQPPQQ